MDRCRNIHTLPSASMLPICHFWRGNFLTQESKAGNNPVHLIHSTSLIPTATNWSCIQETSRCGSQRVVVLEHRDALGQGGSFNAVEVCFRAQDESIFHYRRRSHETGREFVLRHFVELGTGLQDTCFALFAEEIAVPVRENG